MPPSLLSGKVTNEMKMDAVESIMAAPTNTWGWDMGLLSGPKKGNILYDSRSNVTTGATEKQTVTCQFFYLVYSI